MASELEVVKTASNLGLPFIILLFFHWGLKRLWSDFWPWWVENYWPARNAASLERFNQQEKRELRTQELVNKFLDTIKRYENGARAQSAIEHAEIITLLKSLTSFVLSEKERNEN